MLAAPLLLCCSMNLLDVNAERVKREVDTFERITLQWVQAMGTEASVPLHKAMELQRNRVIEIGEPAITKLQELLKHKQVNVRRGAAIALSYIVEGEEIADERLLDFVLLRLIEDEDIKTRSNLYHVVNGIVDNLKKAEVDK